MGKVKRVLALIGCIVIIALFLAAFVAAILGADKQTIFALILLGTVISGALYAFLLITRFFRQRK